MHTLWGHNALRGLGTHYVASKTNVFNWLGVYTKLGFKNYNLLLMKNASTYCRHMLAHFATLFSWDSCLVKLLLILPFSELAFFDNVDTHFHRKGPPMMQPLHSVDRPSHTTWTNILYIFYCTLKVKFVISSVLQSLRFTVNSIKTWLENRYDC